MVTSANNNLTNIPADSILNSISSHIAILDKNGVILQTNRAWQEFALSNNVMMRPDMTGVNYLSLCDNTEGDSFPEAREVSDGIRAVIAGKIEEFVKDYACHSRSEKGWFYMRVTRLNYKGPLRVVVAHENITALKLAEEALKDRKRELIRKAEDLDELNAALRILLKQRDKDKKELEEKIISNINLLVLPCLEKIKTSTSKARQKGQIKLLEEHLAEVTSPLLKNISIKHRSLTPREIMVANFIKNGRTSKEIAEIINISIDTVDFHRKNIRNKLGLTNKKGNLRSFLLSLSE
ncbi:MAG: LuxR C-terminal-related transcriptional regulator [Desulfobacteraceae bacterium]